MLFPMKMVLFDRKMIEQMVLFQRKMVLFDGKGKWCFLIGQMMLFDRKMLLSNGKIFVYIFLTAMRIRGIGQMENGGF